MTDEEGWETLGPYVVFVSSVYQCPHGLNCDLLPQHGGARQRLAKIKLWFFLMRRPLLWKCRMKSSRFSLPHCTISPSNLSVMECPPPEAVSHSTFSFSHFYLCSPLSASSSPGCCGADVQSGGQGWRGRCLMFIRIANRSHRIPDQIRSRGENSWSEEGTVFGSECSAFDYSGPQQSLISLPTTPGGPDQTILVLFLPPSSP